MNISVTPRYKKELVKVTDKYVRYRIYNIRKYYSNKTKYARAAGGPFRDNKGNALFVYDFGDSLRFATLSYSFDKKKEGEKPSFNNSQNFKYTLKIKDNKLNLWYSDMAYQGNTGVATKRIRNMSNHVDRFGLFHAKATKIHRKRANSIIKNFLRRHKIKFKYTKDYQQNVFRACYPGVRDFSGLNLIQMNSLYSKHFRHGDIKYVIKKCFGFNSKKLVKLICKKIEEDKNFNILALGPILKGLIPIDYFYQLIEREGNYHHYFDTHFGRMFKVKDIRDLLKNFKNNPRKILTLFQDPNMIGYNFDDSIRMYQEFGREKDYSNCRSWRDIHGVIAPVRAVPAREWARNYSPTSIEHYDLPIRDKYKELNGKVIGDFKFEVPGNTKDLATYSDKMSNCVRQYGTYIKNGGNILAIYKGEELAYNISVNHRRIDQFLGKCNSQPPEDDKKKIIDILVKENIISLMEKEEQDIFIREYPAQFVANIDYAVNTDF